MGYELGTEPGSKSKKKAHIGNAIFFRASAWQPLAKGRICFAQLLAERYKENIAQCSRYAAGQQVASWTRLLHRCTQRVVVAVSVHIGANWRNPDTRIAQVDTMMRELGQIVEDGES